MVWNAKSLADFDAIGGRQAVVVGQGLRVPDAVLAGDGVQRLASANGVDLDAGVLKGPSLAVIRTRRWCAPTRLLERRHQSGPGDDGNDDQERQKACARQKNTGGDA